MTKTQIKLRQWFRKHGFSVVDNNGGLGTVNLLRDPLEIDYFAFDDENSVIIKLYDEDGDYIYTKLKIDELKKLVELIETCRIELEYSRVEHYGN